MKTTEVKLAEGWRIAAKPATKVVLGFFTAGELLDAESQPTDVARGLYLLAKPRPPQTTLAHGAMFMFWRLCCWALIMTTRATHCWRSCGQAAKAR